jgi:hypothetical protein
LGNRRTVSVERSVIFSKENLPTAVDDSVEVRGSEAVDLARERAKGLQVDESDEADEDEVLEAQHLRQAPKPRSSITRIRSTLTYVFNSFAGFLKDWCILLTTIW